MRGPGQLLTEKTHSIKLKSPEPPLNRRQGSDHHQYSSLQVAHRSQPFTDQKQVLRPALKNYFQHRESPLDEMLASPSDSNHSRQL